MPSVRFVLCLILYGSIYGAVFVVDDIIAGRAHTAVGWLALFGEPFLLAIALALAVIFAVTIMGKVRS